MAYTRWFRRFRSSILAKSGVLEDIRKFWLGHQNNDITAAQYAEQMRDDDTWRQTLPAKVGLGFQIPAFVPSQLSIMSAKIVRQSKPQWWAK